MKSFISILIAGSLMIFPNSCIKNGCDSPKLPYQVLTDSIKVWLPYAANADIIFEDSLFNYDTIQLQDYFSGDDDIYRGEECAMGKGQFIRCSFYDSRSTDTIIAEIGFVNHLNIDRKSTHLFFDGAANAAYPTNGIGGYLDSTSLNGKIFRSCVWLECAATGDCSPSGITNYFFAKHRGLVAFRRNNVLWTLK